MDGYLKDKICEFKINKACRLHLICVRLRFGKHKNAINRCPVFWKLKVRRAHKRLGLG